MQATFVVLTTLGLVLGVQCAPQKVISVTLDSKWSSTPLHLEASEFFAEESNDHFWRFVSDFQNVDLTTFSNCTPKAQYETVLEVASKHLSPAKLALLKLSLSLRSHSPAVETFQQAARDKGFPADCDFVLEVRGGGHFCDLDKLDQVLQNLDDSARLYTYKMDHFYAGSPNPQLPLVILYGDLAAKGFRRFHEALQKRAQDKQISYILRHFVKTPSARKVRLSGYGVELAIKSTEYKAQDDTKVKEEKSVVDSEETEKAENIAGFDFKKLKELYPEKKDKLNELKAHLMDSGNDLVPLKVWELQELSLQAAQKILLAPLEDALRIMRDTSQNFPSQARSLVNVAVDAGFKKEVERNQQMFLQTLSLEPSDAALFFNGLYYDAEVTDVFTMLQLLKQETRLLEGLHNIGISKDTIPRLMKMDLLNNKQEYGVDIRDTAVQYINDIEHDPSYRGWPTSVQDMLRPTYPGMLRNVRKNMYHLVVVADPSQDNARDILKLAESFYVHRAPLRIGIVFAVNPNMSVTGYQDAGVAMLNAFNFISQDRVPYEGLSFITDVYAAGREGVTAEIVIKQFKTKYPGEDLDLVFGEDSDYDTGRKLAWEFINKTGIGTGPQALLNGVLLKQSHLNADMFEEAVLTEIMKQTPNIQRSIYKGDLNDSQDVLDFLMEQPNIMPRLNQKILSPGANYLDMTGRVVVGLSLEDFAALTMPDMVSTFASHLLYLYPKEKTRYYPLTAWVVGDFDTPSGRLLLSSALEHFMETNEMRVGVIFNPSEAEGRQERSVNRAVWTALESLPSDEAASFIRKLLKEKNYDDFLARKRAAEELLSPNSKPEAFKKALEDCDGAFLGWHSSFARLALKLGPTERAVVINGRVIGPLEDGEEFNTDDFNLMERYSMSTYGTKIKEVISEEGAEPSELDSELAMKTACVLLSHMQTKSRHSVLSFGEEKSVLKIPASQPEEPAHEVVAVVDPVSRGAQKVSQLLLVLQNVINANVKIFFNCVDKHSDMPLKSYYRFVLESEPSFGLDGQFGQGPYAKFVNMPQSPLLTLGMATPENWLVEAVRSPYDLDNIHMEQVESRVHAEFELEHLLLEGHCFEQSSGNPPRGLQFNLGTQSNTVVADTIVMANLGYFQLKANPGLWTLRLRQGRSSELYDVTSHEFTDSPQDSDEVLVMINSFRSHVLKVKVSKKPGKQNEDLLSDGDEDPNDIWSSFTQIPIIGGILAEWKQIGKAVYSSIVGERPKTDDEEQEDRINIFSLASGHLYERLLRIMMLSVLKNTKTPVKFWFLKNYLSPTFKDVLPHMAKEYGFDYELVQYKWPRWLNQQTEKQRIIWGYKILFLDVLFPLDVKKIIFVDADQVVRADMKELRDLDLGGAPYGYTPFCDSRQDMEGYRFWKSGYWASHLGGRRYHISALYVVDLKRFRRIAAGDRLRGQYQGLSQDPNSLSNLDQDLPNNMIHQVAIKSLPQEWLWCETWCDDDSKKQAKTIDLCNNPKTKEPKLVSAARIISEWKDYDEELKQFIERYEKGAAKATLTEGARPAEVKPDDGTPHDIHTEL
ncbi:UDP-glucose:glycoprotein glucosyltransferase 1 isoform X1 [Ixodes scapularis]|uniref:UDP-glucose:glycoprotein glucosyltransferase 1 isoform X1 n=1 Tax=Ixodes scapularis TaxID=6945 RepID=UPI001C37ED75|nr:UDP-glucose:glycoprotein glucosyltransferase 1 isoform X1 [Ixodes scapularis]XP_042150052.1 UDP-glucose:glycoprotein glucosyltransferase 1 isoform X1 [Ixodes scapularis]